ncbi:MAG: DM13 domain-containing protein [Rhodobacteraceae bacterium]|nr:DM13 domain-containing protein [Paracoccaceae bacterium]
MKRAILFLITHGIALAIGFAGGIYLLPILTAPPSPDSAMLEEEARAAVYSVELTRDAPGNDRLHWGEGTLSITPERIVHEGRLAPGPDYRVYLVPGPVGHEDDFEPLKATSIEVGAVKSFGGFLIDLPADVDIEAYNTVLVWCEAFGEYITAGTYR